MLLKDSASRVPLLRLLPRSPPEPQTGFGLGGSFGACSGAIKFFCLRVSSDWWRNRGFDGAYIWFLVIGAIIVVVFDPFFRFSDENHEAASPSNHRAFDSLLLFFFVSPFAKKTNRFSREVQPFFFCLFR